MIIIILSREVICVNVDFLFVDNFDVSRFEVFMAVKVQVEVLWVLTPRTVVIGYQFFRGPCCLRPEMKGEGLDLELRC
jgi:hypothetical protein